MTKSKYRCNLCGELRVEKDRGYWYNSYCEKKGKTGRFYRTEFNLGLLRRGPEPEEIVADG